MAYSIEDTIIAYFDGRLNDEDSADLLHRASVSPEIRALFQEHAALRRMAVRAAQHATIAPDLEESLFNRIEELRNEKELPLGFWSVRRFAFAAAAMALILVGVANSFQTQESPNIIALKPGTDRIANQYDLTYASFNQSTQLATTANRSAEHANVSTNATAPEIVPVVHNDAEPDIRIHPEPRTLAAIPIEIPVSQTPTMQSLRDLARPNTFSMFEIGIAAPISGGFIQPAVSGSLGLFTDQTISAAYNLDSYNQLGVQLTNGNFPHLTQASTNSAGFTSVTGELSPAQTFIGQIFYRHREPVNGLFFVMGGIGGGLTSYGTVVSAELGIEIPFADHLLGGVSFVADRLSQKGQTPSQIMDASSTPIIYSGSSALNTLTGRIEYALMYQF